MNETLLQKRKSNIYTNPNPNATPAMLREECYTTESYNAQGYQVALDTSMGITCHPSLHCADCNHDPS
jgi:hypothetical protein